MLQRAEFAFFHRKQGNQLTYYVKMNCFYFVKIDSHNNKRDINVKMSKLGNGGESEKKKTFSAPDDLPNNVLKYCSRITLCNSQKPSVHSTLVLPNGAL
jgi:hypothetical protein